MHTKCGADGKYTPCLLGSSHERTLKEHNSKRKCACCNGDYPILRSDVKMYDTATLIDRHAGNQDKSVLLFM